MHAPTPFKGINCTTCASRPQDQPGAGAVRAAPHAPPGVDPPSFASGDRARIKHDMTCMSRMQRSRVMPLIEVLVSSPCDRCGAQRPITQPRHGRYVRQRQVAAGRRAPPARHRSRGPPSRPRARAPGAAAAAPAALRPPLQLPRAQPRTAPAASAPPGASCDGVGHFELDIAEAAHVARELHM